MPLVTIIVWISAAPVCVVLAMLAMGLVQAWPAIAVAAVSLGSAVLFGRLLARDLIRVSTAFRQLEAGGPLVTPRAGNPPVLLEALDQEVARLARGLIARSARIDEERRADKLILDKLPDPLVVLRPDLTVTRRNPAAERVFGDDLAAILRHPALRDTLEQALSHGLPRDVELTIAAPVARELRAAVVPISPPFHDGGRAVVVLSDRTGERSMQRAHTDFVANVSHELRTPLAALIGFTDTLLGAAENDPEARRRFLMIMAEQGARMNRLIDDLLNLSQIEMVEHEMPSEMVDLATLLPRMVAAYEPRLSTEGGRIDVQIANDLPLFAGDGDQIAQVVQNLLDNAVKYGRDRGVVRLEVRISPGGGEPVEPRFPARPGIVLTVADEGIGIPREHIPRLTERFYRVDKGRSRAVGGTGLGLAIVKHVTNRHRGRLLIDSDAGKGTVVRVWLPLTGGGG